MNEDFFQTDLSWLGGEIAEVKSAAKGTQAAVQTLEAANGKKYRSRAKSKVEWAGEVFTVSMGPVRARGFKLTEDHKRKISEGNKGVSRKTVWLGRTHSEETKEKIRQINLNRVPHVFTAEEKAEIGRKISEAKKGKKRDAATIEKMAQANRGRKQSAEEKEKRAAKLRGRKRSPEVVAKAAAAAAKKICRPVMTPYGLFKSRLAALDALVANGHSPSAFYRLLKRRPTEFYYVNKV
jgi:glutaredoxin